MLAKGLTYSSYTILPMKFQINFGALHNGYALRWSSQQFPVPSEDFVLYGDSVLLRKPATPTNKNIERSQLL